MANTPQEIDTDKLRADPRVIEQLNQAVIKEFRANQGKVVGLTEETPELQALASTLDILGQPLLLLTMVGANTGRTPGSPSLLLTRWRSPRDYRLPWRRPTKSTVVL